MFPLATSSVSASAGSPPALNPFANYDTEAYVFWYIFYAALFLLFYVFSSPFTSNRELRRHWTGYVYFSTVLYIWLFVAVASHLPILYYDTAVPLSMFSPLFLASVSTLFCCEGVLKLLNSYFVYHVGFRQNSMEVVQNSVVVSIICCIVYTQCGTSSSSVLEAAASQSDHLHGTVNAMCAFFFSGHTNSHSKDLPTVLVLWSTAMSMLVLNFAFERLIGYRGLFAEADDGKAAKTAAVRSVKFADTAPSILSGRTVQELHTPPSARSAAAARMLPSPVSMTGTERLSRLPVTSYARSLSPRMQQELLQPEMLDMVSWYALAATSTVVDMLIHLKLFLGRFDMRTLQAAMPQSAHYTLPVPAIAPSPIDFRPAPSALSPLLDSHSHLSSPSSDRPLPVPSSSSSPLSHVHRHHLDEPFYYSHLACEPELWFDWMSDCGDGFNPSYQVARKLAQPSLNVALRRRTSSSLGMLQLPRARVLLLGGDLAYPSPTTESYESRFFRPFQCALPPPLGYDPAAISFQKPLGGMDALRQYDGPQCFLIPGNHDWFDGLQTYLRYVCSRDWLGGWLMPQEKSWFALQLPHGWWLFALDNALNNDIDPVQFQYFARLAAGSVQQDDRVILCYHEPDWVINAHEKVDIGQNIHYLQTVLDGKVVLKLAGDLHHYTRHMPAAPSASSASDPAAAAAASSPLSTYPVNQSPSFSSPVMQSEFDEWCWYSPLSWIRTFIAGRREYNSRVFLEDVLEDIAPEANGQLRLARAQSLPFLPLHTESPLSISKSSADMQQEESGRPLEGRRSRVRGMLSLLQSPPLSPLLNATQPPPSSPPSSRAGGRPLHRIHSGRMSPVLRVNSPPRSPASPARPGRVQDDFSVGSGRPAAAAAPSATLPADMREWTVEQVTRWVRKVGGTSETVQAFAAQDINGRLLCKLDDDDLAAELGLSSRLQRKQLLAERDVWMQVNRARDETRETQEGETRLPPPSAVAQPALVTQLSDNSDKGRKDGDERKEGEAVSSSGISRPGSLSSPPGYLQAAGFTSANETPPPPPTLPALSASERGVSSLGYERVSLSHPLPTYRQPPILIVSGGGGAFLHGTHTPSSAPIDVRGDTYLRSASYPSISTSRTYALFNIFGFRKRNWRFDIFGGGVYFLLVSSVLPLCHLDSILEGDGWADVLARFFRYVALVHVKMVEETWLSLSVFLAVWVGFVILAEESWPMWKRFIVGTIHCLAHSFAAFSALVLLETCVEFGLKRHLLGHHESLLSTFMLTFPSTASTIGLLDYWSWGMFSRLLSIFSALLDIPEAMASLKTKMCAAYPSHLASILSPSASQPEVSEVFTALLSLSRWHLLGYYVSTGLYLWVLATSLVSFVFGTYLYIMSAFLNAHATPAFSSLRFEGYKNFIRFHLTRAGELELYVLGLDRCPRRWEVDPLWGGFGRRGEGDGESWRWSVPSSLRPVKGEPDAVRLVDYLVIRKTGAERMSEEGTVMERETSEESSSSEEGSISSAASSASSSR